MARCCRGTCCPRGRARHWQSPPRPAPPALPYLRTDVANPNDIAKQSEMAVVMLRHLWFSWPLRRPQRPQRFVLPAPAGGACHVLTQLYHGEACLELCGQATAPVTEPGLC